jgi:short-subunit dehydrogenase
MASLNNKVVWITGASSGIGLELSRQLSAKGCKLILSARRTDILEANRKELAHPDKAICVKIDLEQPEHFAEAVNTVISKFGKVDLMVHNAGISQRSYVLETDLSVDRRIMEINFMGTVALTKALLPHMVKQGSGYFAVVTSLVGKYGFGVRSSYAASKHALHGFFESLHIELADQGIGVTMICPGPVRTGLSLTALDGNGKPTGVMDDMQVHGMPVEKAVAEMIRAIEQGRREVVVGGFKERLSVKLKAWLPGLFFNMIKKQNPRGAVK